MYHTIIQNVYDLLFGNKYFSCLDAMSGFHQLKLHKILEKLQVFLHLQDIINLHVFFLILQMYLKNVKRQNYKINCCYLDDCVCFGKTFDKHLNSLESTFECLLKYELKLKISKCKFGYTQMKMLGNIIDGQGIKSTEEELLAIKQFPR